MDSMEQRNANEEVERSGRRTKKTHNLCRTGMTYTIRHGQIIMKNTSIAMNGYGKFGSGKTGYMLIGWRGAEVTIRTVRTIPVKGPR